MGFRLYIVLRLVITKQWRQILPKKHTVETTYLWKKKEDQNIERLMSSYKREVTLFG